MELGTLLQNPYLYTGLSTAITTAILVYKGGPSLVEAATSYYNSIVKSFEDLRNLEHLSEETRKICLTRAEKIKKDQENLLINNQKLIDNLVQKNQDYLEDRLKLLESSQKSQEKLLLQSTKSRLSLKLLAMALAKREN